MMRTFKSLWHERFPGTPPIGYRLRGQVPTRWIRLHSLPRSKRYPGTPEEYGTVLDRANQLAEELFKEGDLFWLVASRPNGNPNEVTVDPEFCVQTNFDLPKVFSWEDAQEKVEDRVRWSTHAKLLTWHSKLYNEIFQKIADDEEYGILFTTANLSSILAPYDGGFDLILANAGAVLEVKSKFRSWLSDRENFL